MLFRVKGKRVQCQVIFNDGNRIIAKCIEGTVVFDGTVALFDTCISRGFFVHWPDNYF